MKTFPLKFGPAIKVVFSELNLATQKEMNLNGKSAKIFLKNFKFRIELEIEAWIHKTKLIKTS